ncbi:hypothetical protein ACOSP7_014348 [Xanthoceras sorbifolium]
MFLLKEAAFLPFAAYVSDENSPRKSTRIRRRRGEVMRIEEEEEMKEGRKSGSERRDQGRDLLPRNLGCGAHWSTRGEPTATKLAINPGRDLGRGTLWREMVN